MKVALKLALIFLTALPLFSAGFNPLTKERVEISSVSSNEYIIDSTFTQYDVLNLFFNLSDGDRVIFEKSFQKEVIFPQEGITIDRDIEIYGVDKSVCFKPFHKNSPLFRITKRGRLKLSDINISDFSTEIELIENRGTLVLENLLIKEINSSTALINNKESLEIFYSAFENITLTNASVIESQGFLKIDSSSFYRNSLLGAKGIVYSLEEMTIINTTFGENLGSGSAVFVESGYAEVLFSTIAYNTQGIENLFGHVEIKNSIVSNNRQTQCQKELYSLGNNIIQEQGSCFLMLKDSDLLGNPKLISFEKYDGEKGVYVVGHNSLAYGLADNLDFSLRGVGVDQRGKIFDERVTAGAYEVTAEEYNCKLQNTKETSGTLLIKEEGFVKEIFVSSIDPQTKEVFCTQKLYVGDSKLIPYSIGVDSTRKYEVIYSLKKNSIKEVVIQKESKKTIKDKPPNESIEVFDESLFIVTSDIYLTG